MTMGAADKKKSAKETEKAGAGAEAKSEVDFASQPDEKLPFFPYRFMAVDVGSNAIKHRVWEVEEDGSVRQLAERRFPIRLGQGTFRTGLLAARDIDATVAAFKEIRTEMRALGVHAMRAVATSAMREASNSLTLVRRVQREAGLALEILPDAEEARLIGLGVLGSRPAVSEQYLLIDIGGGSTEVILASEPDIVTAMSVRLGAVRLHEMFFTATPPPPAQLALAGDHIKDVLEKTLHLPPLHANLHCLGSAGTITALTAMVGGLGGGHTPDGQITLAEVGAIVERAGKMTKKEIVTTFSLDAQRAEVILPGALVLRAILSRLKVERLALAHGGVSDGLLQVFLERAGLRRSRLFDHDRLFSVHALALGERYQFNAHHAQQVSHLALAIFDQLAPLHGLGPAERRLLKGAALLHDIGQFVSFSGHHKHSQYLIQHSDLPGLSEREKLLLALTARYHRKAHPKAGHEEFAALAKDEKERVKRLAAILRIADGLDREQQSLVREVRVTLQGREAHFYIAVQYQAAIEIWSARQKAALFEEVFGLTAQFFVVSA